MSKLDHLRGRYSQRTLESMAMFDESEVPLDVIVDLVRHIHAYEGEGAILIFLSGWEEISAVRSSVSYMESKNYLASRKEYLLEMKPGPMECVDFILRRIERRCWVLDSHESVSAFSLTKHAVPAG